MIPEQDEMYYIVKLAKGVEDDDGQVWFDDGDIRVDLSGGQASAWINGHEVTEKQLRAAASELLGAAAVLEKGSV